MADRLCARRLRQALAASAVAVGLLHAGGVHAQSLRCGNLLAGVGDSKFSVVQKCGEPMSREQICVPRLQSEYIVSPYGGAPRQILSTQCIPMEDWVFHRGQGNFLGIVRFQNGTVESVRDGDRVP